MLKNAPVEWTSHVDGMPHVRSTIRKMSELAKKGAASYSIRNLATRITRDVPSKFPTAELGALYGWVRDHIRYRYDPLGLEWLQSPARTVLEGAGDCDDIATLLGALAGALGHPYRFRTVGSSPTAQAHVQVQAFDRKRWINLDPVLEPTQHTAAPRTDPGTFAMFAGGSDHLWDSEGNMLSGPVSRQQMELWAFAPYFTQVPPYADSPPARFGVPARPDIRYRSVGAPGPWQMPRKVRGQDAYAIALRPGTLSPGQLQGIEPYYHPTLGAGRILRKLKKVAKKVVKGVKTVINKVPGLKQLAKMAISVIPGASTAIQAGKAVASVAKGIKKIKKGAKGAKRAVAAVRPAAARPAAARPAAVRPAKIAAVGKRPAPAKRRAPTVLRVAPAPVAVSLAANAARSRSPATAAAKQYPPNARMLFDRGASGFRVFVPIAGAPVAVSDDDGDVSGLGIIKPSLTLSLLGAADPLAASSARAAIGAVQAFVAGNKRPPAIPLAAVKAFQLVAGGSPALKPDGLWGPNTKAAAGYHAPGVALPAVAPAFAKKAATWKPSAAAAGPAKTQPKAPPAGASFLPPPGYVEVGTEKSNPGLPPAGYTGPAALPAPPVPGTPPQPSAPAGDAATTKVAIGRAKLNRPSPGWSPAGSSPLNPPSPGWSPAGGGPAPVAPQGDLWRQDQQWLTQGAEYRAGAGAPGSSNAPLWLAIAYLYFNRKKAA